MTLLSRMAERTEITDEEIKGLAYGIEYAEFANGEIEAAGLTVTEYIARKRELHARLKEIERAKRAAKSGRPQADYPDGRTLDCGCVVYYKSEVLTASLGTSCADCYDEMSD